MGKPRRARAPRPRGRRADPAADGRLAGRRAGARAAASSLPRARVPIPAPVKSREAPRKAFGNAPEGTEKVIGTRGRGIVAFGLLCVVTLCSSLARHRTTGPFFFFAGDIFRWISETKSVAPVMRFRVHLTHLKTKKKNAKKTFGVGSSVRATAAASSSPAWNPWLESSIKIGFHM